MKERRGGKGTKVQVGGWWVVVGGTVVGASGGSRG